MWSQSASVFRLLRGQAVVARVVFSILTVLSIPRCLSASGASGGTGTPNLAVEEQLPIGTVLPVDRIKRWSFEEQRHPPSLRALRSDAKVFVVHVWGTWCQPCLEEFPLLKKMFPEGRGGDAQLILVALQSSEESLRKFAREHVAEIPTAPQYSDADGALPQALGMNRLPITLLVDRQWVIRQAFYGTVAAPQRRNDLLNSIERFLRPPLLTAYADGYLSCPRPPCIEPSFFLHRSLILENTSRWNPQKRTLSPAEIELPYGSQTTFLYVFPPGCRECLQDIERLQKVAAGWRKAKAPKVSFVFLLWSADVACSQQLLEQNVALFAGATVAHSSMPELGQILDASGYPVSLIMNRQGYVRNSFVGLYQSYQKAATDGLLTIAKER